MKEKQGEKNILVEGVIGESSKNVAHNLEGPFAFGPERKKAPLDKSQVYQSLFGSQAQPLKWPSQECWNLAFDQLLGATTRDKYHREQTLFNPILDIEDFRCYEAEHGPRKRKAMDGFFMLPAEDSCNSFDTPLKINDSTSSPHHVQQNLNNSPLDTGCSFSPGSIEKKVSGQKRGRPRKIGDTDPIEVKSSRRRGRPLKEAVSLSAKPVSLKKEGKRRISKKDRKHYSDPWNASAVELAIDLDNHFVIIEKNPNATSSCVISEILENEDPQQQSTEDIIAWNCHGLGNKAAVRQLTVLIRQSNPEVIIISETRLSLEKFHSLCGKLHFVDGVYVPPVGRAGGIGLYWKRGVRCEDAQAGKEVFWNRVSDLIINNSIPTLLIGDLNGTLVDHETLHYSNRGNATKYSFDLRRMVSRTGVIDLGAHGGKFTWFQKTSETRSGCTLKRARLDRALASVNWRMLHPNAIVRVLSAATSDHWPILLDMEGVPLPLAKEISDMLGMKKMSKDSIYLGLPLFRSRKRTKDLQFLVDKVMQQVNSWKSRLLSKAGRACLIQSVGSSIATYVAASDVIPKSIARKVDKELRDFLWGDTSSKKTIHTISWNSLYHPKLRGGLGFRKVETINQAFLLKWGWKALTDNQSFWGRIVQAKYLKHRQFLDIESVSGDSGLWKAIVKARSLLSEGLCRKIGNGKETSICCPICGEGMETVFHLLWECSLAKALWFNSGLGMRVDRIDVHEWQHWCTWFKTLHNRPPNVSFEDILIVGLCIVETMWKERNSIIHGGDRSIVRELILHLNRRISEHRLVATGDVEEVCVWSPPPVSWMCCNCDVAMSKDGSVIATVARDEKGSILTIKAENLLVSDPKVAEAHAICMAADLSVERRMGKVIFQSDNLRVVNAFSAEFESAADFNLANLRCRFLV
ncbi:hypothetical protein F8388_013104 [Cannabis sativa]|uniref:Reverse transcriptase n=1 Tax=Cannabis sativa TaxID=3483 RepID=A0A7J6HLT1_CANSA|nr:hypothetical protein F8388_013104 [Cannabis sativa]